MREDQGFFGFNNKQGDILSQAETFHDGIKAIVFERLIKQATSGKSLMPHGTYIGFPRKALSNKPNALKWSYFNEPNTCMNIRF